MTKISKKGSEQYNLKPCILSVHFVKIKNHMEIQKKPEYTGNYK